VFCFLRDIWIPQDEDAGIACALHILAGALTALKTLPLRAQLFIAAVIIFGVLVLRVGLTQYATDDFGLFACFLLLTLLASGLKVNLPGVTGTMSVIFLFVLLGIQELSLGRALLTSCTGVVVQCVWNAKSRPKLVQVAFNVASMATATATSYWTFHSQLPAFFGESTALKLAAAACVFFLTNTIPVACVIALTESKPLRKVWSECYFWSFPYYLAGAALAGLIALVDRAGGRPTSLLLFPVIYLVYRSYRLYLTRLEAEKNHVEEMAALHLRTIEALALAIEAKDQRTHDHLRRVQAYAVGIGKEMALSDPDMEALRAAAILHDIGKLAVPEHIISKPGKLTPEEFEKIKIHPMVGAEILERVNFPYPVVPIVRAHHEKWNGGGYPIGLRGEEIPIGARILSVVDCFDALASDRSYRPGLTGEDALRQVESEAGKSFDPKVVDCLKRHLLELEKDAQVQESVKKLISVGVKIDRSVQPAAGFEITSQASTLVHKSPIDFLASIASARQEVQTLYELSQELGNSLSLDDTLSVLSVRLKRLIPHDSIVIYVNKDGRLVPEYVSGENHAVLTSLQIPFGEGVSGWVAANRKPIVNGNPAVEPGYRGNPAKYSTLRSAMAVPLESVSGVVGVLTLYHAHADAFSRDHVRILTAIQSKLALSVENALKFRMAESSATTDYLTGLPNARSLFLHLDSELARCKRTTMPLTVLVCDLDGFKQVNDRFGHLVGNQVLRSIAQKLKEACREYDYAARMGGDEFVLVLPGLKPETVQATESRLHRLAVEVGREVCGESLLALSVGHASYPTAGLDAEDLLAAADRRMYVEKQEHRNESYTRAALLSLECAATKVC